MHLRMFELAKDALLTEGYDVLGCYMSPVGDAYNKKGLAPAEHRIRLCQLATQDSPFVMVDPWEATQSSYQRTLTVLSRVEAAVNSRAFAAEGNFTALFPIECLCFKYLSQTSQQLWWFAMSIEAL
jgi:nicotinamide mononucleotide adenylyltransferase